MKLKMLGSSSLARAAKAVLAEDAADIVDVGDAEGADDAPLTPAPAPTPAPAEPAPAPEPEPAPAEPAAPETQATATAREDGARAERERTQAVFASEHFGGREALAGKMLASGKLSADEIIDVLGSSPKAGADNAMLGRLAGNRNPDLEPGTEAAAPQAGASQSWDRTFERLGWNK